MEQFANLSTVWARLLLGSLADAGVREVVVSPGSRSTPLVVAALAEPRLTCRFIHDERSAAFFALGSARVSGQPSLLLCTSGTAVANYWPAVIEAAMAHLPLLVLSADRPFELDHCGANQTINQLHLFGSYCREFFDLGRPDASPHALRALRRTVAQAVLTTTYPRPGAVHLNVRLRKPLEPQAAVTPAEADLAAHVEHLLATPLVQPSTPRLSPDPLAVRELVAALRQTERGLIVCGPAPLAQQALAPTIRELGQRTGFPVLAETASQVRLRPAADRDPVMAAGSWLLGSPDWKTTHGPELVVQVGPAPTAAGWEPFLAQHLGRYHHWVLTPFGWQDPQSSATRLLVADLAATLTALLEALPPSTATTQSAWTRSWQQADAAWAALLAAELTGDALTEGAVAHEVVAGLPSASLLVLGNSLPIRQVDRFANGRGIDAGVLCQRGASGIDGVLSGAAGAASAAGRPTLLLIGDISLLHDLSGFWCVRQIRTPFAVVVVNNDGGRIFEQLPLASHPVGEGSGFDFWVTPHGCNFDGVAATFALPYFKVQTRRALRQALTAAMTHPGGTLIEAVVPPHSAAEQHRRLLAQAPAVGSGIP